MTTCELKEPPTPKGEFGFMQIQNGFIKIKF